MILRRWFILTAVLTLSLAACGDTDEDAPHDPRNRAPGTGQSGDGGGHGGDDVSGGMSEGPSSPDEGSPLFCGIWEGMLGEPRPPSRQQTAARSQGLSAITVRSTGSGSV